MANNLPLLEYDIPISIRAGSSPDSAHKDADKALLNHVLTGGGNTTARKYTDLSLRLAWVKTPGGIDFSAAFTFSVYADGWCTVGLNKGFGFELRGANGPVYRVEPARMPEMQKPRETYFISRDFAINQSIFDRAEIFRFIGAADYVIQC